MELQTTNPHCFTYQTEELLIELLGGIRIDGLDRMRVTIKVTVVNRKHAGYLTNPELAGLSVRHNLDLYNDTQVEKFVRRVAEKLETGSIALTKAIADITSQLEQYRLLQLDKQETRREKALSREEREQAIQFLEQKDLLDRTNELIGKSGVIGEETNRLLTYLIFTSRKREHPLHTIYGLANNFDALNKTKTEFQYEGSKMTAEDVGNFHFGVVGEATGIFPQEVMLRQAGAAQIRGGTSRPEWQKYGTREVNAGRGETRTVRGEMLPPYGDDPRDQEMIINGFNYYNNNKAELKKPEED